MNNVIFYRDQYGHSEVEDYLQLLQHNDDKDSRINTNKIIAYINMLEKYGLGIGEPYIKRINKDILELRPIRNRILFANYENNKFIFLNIFIKQSKKTPKKEIKKAEKMLKDFKKRSDTYG